MTSESLGGSVPSEAEFRQRLRAWLATNIKRRTVSSTGLEGGDPLAKTRESPGESDDEYRRLQRSLFDAGFAGVEVSETYGGRGLPQGYRKIMEEEMSRHGVKVPSVFIDVLLKWGSEYLKTTHIPRILSGEERWTLLLSEPTGGSDLAALRTKAKLIDEQFIVSGHKAWNSRAQFADYGFCLLRTDPTVEKHAGLSVLLVPLKVPGVTIRPIKQITGVSEFCEVFLDDVPVPASNLIGELNNGWAVAKTQMDLELSTAGGRGRIDLPGEMVRLAEQRKGDLDETRLEGLAVDAFIRSEVERCLVARVQARVSLGETPRYALALCKLIKSWRCMTNAEAAMDLGGRDVVAWLPSEPQAAGWAIEYLDSRGRSIGAGTREMQLNTVAERILGLPRESRLDVGKAFQQLTEEPADGSKQPPYGTSLSIPWTVETRVLGRKV